MSRRSVLLWLLGLLATLAVIAGLSAAPRQVVLVEHFTNTGSATDATYNPGIHAALAAMTRDTVVKISYHTWWPAATDTFYEADSTDVSGRVSFYGVGTTLPDLFVDYLSQPAPNSPATLKSDIRARFATPSPCSMALAAAPAGQTAIQFAVNVAAEQDLVTQNCRLFVALITDRVTFAAAPGSNGETAFPDALRDMAPNANSGDGFAIFAGGEFDYEGLLTRNAAWPADSLTVVAFVQNGFTREILQAAWIEVNPNPGTITLSAPNGGEAYYAGETHAVTWSSTNLTETVRIQLMRAYPGGIWETLAANVSNTGSYNWLVSGPAAAGARLRVIGMSQMTTGDSSNANLSIGSIALTAPNGNDTVLTDLSYSIRWETGAMPENVRIELDRAYPSGNWQLINAAAPNTGSYSWLPTLPVSNNARIRVYGTTHTVTGDTSDTDFILGARTITVTAPNGGENWQAGELHDISWTSTYVMGNAVQVQVNRNYPTGAWETLAASTPNDGSTPWTVTAPGTASARIRVSSVFTPAINDISNSNFTITLPNPPPVLLHDALDDFAPGTGTVTAIATDALAGRSVASVRMVYHRSGVATWDSLSLTATGHPNEYAASLATFPVGRYQYYVQALDNAGLASRVPAAAPTELYNFDVNYLCARTLAYDDGTAESYNDVQDRVGDGFVWAVKFGPVQVPYTLCGARVAIARTHPDAVHTPITVAVYAANGAGGLPGTRLLTGVTGSIGNETGGLPTGVNWAQVIFRDSVTGEPPVINVADFYIAVSNPQPGSQEAFGLDTTSTRALRSYVYDFCAAHWYREDAAQSGCRNGNRMIRAQGFSTAPLRLTARRVDNDVWLRWADYGAPLYRIYSSTNASGPFTLLATSATYTYTHVNAISDASEVRYYQVTAADH
jgi:hypothetical protein